MAVCSGWCSGFTLGLPLSSFAIRKGHSGDLHPAVVEFQLLFRGNDETIAHPCCLQLHNPSHLKLAVAGLSAMRKSRSLNKASLLRLYHRGSSSHPVCTVTFTVSCNTLSGQLVHGTFTCFCLIWCRISDACLWLIIG
jgi:hypothetical protein